MIIFDGISDHEQINLYYTSSLITHLKSIFSWHGAPATLVTDNRPQYSSAEMEQFSSTYGFQHITSSPHYHQSNRQAEKSQNGQVSIIKFL